MNSWNILNSKLSSQQMSELSQEGLHVLRKKQQRIRVLLAGLSVLELMALPTFIWFGTLGSGVQVFGYMLLSVALAWTLTASIHSDGFQSIAGDSALCKKVLDSCQVSCNAEEYRQKVIAHRSLCNADVWHMHKMAAQDVCKTAHSVPV